jgi:hypothetical protein
VAINAVLKERVVNKTRQSKRKANDSIQTLITHERAAATTLLTCSECSPSWYKRRKQEREKKIHKTQTAKGRALPTALNRQGRVAMGRKKEEENTSAGGRETV